MSASAAALERDLVRVVGRDTRDIERRRGGARTSRRSSRVGAVRLSRSKSGTLNMTGSPSVTFSSSGRWSPWPGRSCPSAPTHAPVGGRTGTGGARPRRNRRSVDGRDDRHHPGPSGVSSNWQIPPGWVRKSAPFGTQPCGGWQPPGSDESEGHVLADESGTRGVEHLNRDPASGSCRTRGPAGEC